ncbi:MAG: hypothetical protein AB7N91_30675 [Candidatus Tectimicrobiota bacterium]
MRLHLLTDDDRLAVLPWNRLSAQGRRLVDDGWSIELHPYEPGGFPEYAAHTCYFPGKVVLLGTGDGQPAPQVRAHGHDLQSFFQRHWQEAPSPILASSVAALQEALRTGATRLVYLYGPASAAGVPLADGVMAWSTLAELLQRSQSVSVVLLNLLGEASREAMPATRVLLQGARAVLLLWHAHPAAPEAARAGLAWLSSVLVDSERLDPVEALYQQARQQAVAWTRYASWQTIAPQRISMPELVQVLLDRHRQRADLAQAKNDFYTIHPRRRVYQAVAFGLTGARVQDFPDMLSQHLRHNRRPQEVFRTRTIPVPARLNNPEAIDDLVRQHYHLAPRQPVLPALLDGTPLSGQDFWWIILGWQCTPPLGEAQAGVELIRAIAAWCRRHLVPDMQQEAQYANVRVLSIVAIEVTAEPMAGALEEGLATMSEQLNEDESFHLGPLDQLGKVERRDLREYFTNQQICSCPDLYRGAFPGLLLAGQRDMSFELAVTTIKRGEPDNWHVLYETLQALTASGAWPPEAQDEATFWEGHDGR